MKQLIPVNPRLRSVNRALRRIVMFALVLSFAFSACDKNPHLPGHGYNEPKPNDNDVPPLSGMLSHDNIVMKSIISVDLNRDVARIPLYKGYYHNKPVWFVRTDVSDAALADKLGLNFAPRLANAGYGIQKVTSSDTVAGNAAVNFIGTVDFTPVRKLVPGTTGFPPVSVMPGSVAVGAYSDLIQVKGSKAVYNAPIIATGSGPFDVSQAHTNTLDRVVAIDTINMTVDMQFIRAFAFDKDIFYFSFGATDGVSATIERGTFVPGMEVIPAPDKDKDPTTARSAIFAFANGQTGLNDPNVQGLNHVILDNAPGEFSNDNPALYETFRRLGDARNILGSFTTLANKAESELYSPLWDLHVAKWSDAVVAKGKNYAQTDASTIGQLAGKGLITNPDGTPLSSSGAIVNCPIIGFAVSAPVADQAPSVK